MAFGNFCVKLVQHAGDLSLCVCKVVSQAVFAPCDPVTSHEVSSYKGFNFSWWKRV